MAVTLEQEAGTLVFSDGYLVGAYRILTSDKSVTSEVRVFRFTPEKETELTRTVDDALAYIEKGVLKELKLERS